MNRDEDYLWDRTGQPDPHIQELEEVLKPLAYQPRPLQIPNAQPSSHLSKWLAIAAAVAILLGAGLWSAMPRRATTPVVHQQSIQPAKQQTTAAAAILEKKPTDLQANVARPTVKHRDVNVSEKHVSGTSRKLKRTIIASPEQIAAARAAKEQLMIAFRLTSSKLNIAQRKMSGGPTHNQHKIG